METRGQRVKSAQSWLYHYWRRSVVFIRNVLETVNGVSIVAFEQVNFGWEINCPDTACVCVCVCVCVYVCVYTLQQCLAHT